MTSAKTIQITEESKRVFTAYWNDAPNWQGCSLVGGNVGGSKEERGNLTQLKVAGLITTDSDNDAGTICTWVFFTEAGQAYAAEIGLQAYDYMQ